MDKEKTDTLCNEFSCLYDKDFYFECNEGWFDLIYALSKRLEVHILNIPKRNQHFTKAVQVKEKFGAMRFYMSSGTEEMLDLINKAEKKSTKVCEACGKSGKVIWSNGWATTLCSDCHRKR